MIINDFLEYYESCEKISNSECAWRNRNNYHCFISIIMVNNVNLTNHPIPLTNLFGDCLIFLVY